MNPLRVKSLALESKGVYRFEDDLYHNPHVEMAREIANDLVKGDLVACANILPQMESTYKWKGSLEHSHESVLLLKISDRKESEVVERVKELHAYETPCILSLSVEGGHAPFIQWVEGV